MLVNWIFVVAGLFPGADAPVSTWNFNSPVKALAVSPRGDGFAVVTPARSVFQPFQGKPVELAGKREIPQWGSCLAFDRDGKLLVLAGKRELEIVTPEGKAPAMIIHGRETNTICTYYGRGSLAAFAAGGKALLHQHGRHVHLTRLADGSQLRTFPKYSAENPSWRDWEKEDQPLIRFAASLDGRYLGAFDGTDTLNLYEVATATCLWTSRVDGIDPKHPATIVFAQHGRSLAAWRIQHPDRVTVWETSTGQERISLKLPEEDFGVLALSPDGRTIAASQPNKIRLFDLTRGKEQAIQTESKRICALAFTPSGQHILVGDEEGCIRMHGVPDNKPAASEPSKEQLEKMWQDLQTLRGDTAFQALAVFCDHPRMSIPFLQTRLHDELKAAGEAEILRLIAQLDDDDFAKREQATDRLRQLGTLAEPHLRKAVAGEMATLELRRRVEKLLDGIDRTLTSSATRALERTVEILEVIGTEEARALLVELAQKGETTGWGIDVERAVDRMDLRAGKTKHEPRTK